MALPYFFSVNTGVPVVDPALSALANHQKIPAAETDSTEAGKTPSYPANKPAPVTAPPKSFFKRLAEVFQ